MQTYCLSASECHLFLSIVSHFAKRPPAPSMLPCGYCAPGYPHEPSASPFQSFSPSLLSLYSKHLAAEAVQAIIAV